MVRPFQRDGEGDTHMLVLAVEVSHSPAKPTMSNPVDSWLKNLGWPAVQEEAMKQRHPQKSNESPKSPHEREHGFSGIVTLPCKLMRCY